MLGKHVRSMVLLQHSSHQRLARPPRNVTFFIVWGLHSIPQWQIADQSEEGQQHETDVIYDVVVVAAIFG